MSALRDVTCSDARHDSFSCATWRIPMCDTTDRLIYLSRILSAAISPPWHNVLRRATRLISMCSMTHSYRVCVIRMTNWSLCHSYSGRTSALRDVLRCATWRIPICNMSFGYNKAACMVLLSHLGMCHDNWPVCRANHRQETLWMQDMGRVRYRI